MIRNGRPPSPGAEEAFRRRPRALPATQNASSEGKVA